jgi:CelD/BcsL family acetyltransferase involved in cellulose biosynthesis
MNVSLAFARAARGINSGRLNAAQLRAIEPAWLRLAENAAEENAYYAPHYAKALLDCVEQRNVEALTVMEEGKLLALIPFVRRRYSFTTEAVNLAWQTKFTFSCPPLLAKDRPQEAAQKLVTAMTDGTVPGSIWVIPDIGVDGPAATALRAALDAKSLAYEFIGAFDRAVLDRGISFAEHMRTHVASKRRRDLARNRRRLSELGTLTYSYCTGGRELEHALAEFLRIEAAGWKGRRGTALACQPDTLAFARQAVNSTAMSPRVRADMLSLDGKTIAVGLTIQSGRTGFTIKCTYDETYRNYGAGLLLEEDVIADFLSNDWADRLDSGTSAGHVIEGLWSGTVKIATLVICTDGVRGKARLKEFLDAEERRRRLTLVAKKAAGWALATGSSAGRVVSDASRKWAILPFALAASGAAALVRIRPG